MVNASIAISMGIACPSAHDKNIMRRETDQRGRWRREAAKDKMDPCGRRKSGEQKRRMWLGILWNWRLRGTWPTEWLTDKGKHWTDESQQHHYMTSMKKIETKERKNAHHNDELQGLGDGGQKREVKDFERLRSHPGVGHHGQWGQDRALLSRECVARGRSTRPHPGGKPPL